MSRNACVDHIDPTEGPYIGRIWVGIYGDGVTDLNEVNQVMFETVPGGWTNAVQIVYHDHDYLEAFTPPCHGPGNTPLVGQMRVFGPNQLAGTATFTYQTSNAPPLVPPYDPMAIPPGRGRWRLTLHRRAFSGGSSNWWNTTLITELTHARSRRLEQTLNAAAQLTFTIDGRDPVAALVKDLQTDVIAWRWDEQTGKELPMFRGLVGQSEDIVSEQSHTINFTCHDYFAMVLRRFLTQPRSFVAQSYQDAIVQYLLQWAATVRSPASYLPLIPVWRNPDDTPRTQGGTRRDRSYDAQANLGQLIDDLAHVIDGFDYAVLPLPANGDDYLAVYFPRQGVLRTEPLEYGKSIRSLTRTVNSRDYANFWRVIGSNETQGVPPIAATSANAAADDTSTVGTWMDAEQVSDVTVQATLQERADGNLNRSGVLVPSYSIVLAPDVFRAGSINVGDDVPLIINSGRLQVNSALRVVGRTFDIGDDGDENVGLTVGRPLRQLVDHLTETAADVAALARR